MLTPHAWRRPRSGRRSVATTAELFSKLFCSAIVALLCIQRGVQARVEDGTLETMSSWTPLAQFCFLPTKKKDNIKGKLNVRLKFPASTRTSLAIYVRDEKATGESGDVDTWLNTHDSRKSCTERISKPTRLVLDAWKYPKVGGMKEYRSLLRPQDVNVDSTWSLSSEFVQQTLETVKNASASSVSSSDAKDIINRWLGENDSSSSGSALEVVNSWCDGDSTCSADSALNKVLGMTGSVMLFRNNKKVKVRTSINTDKSKTGSTNSTNLDVTVEEELFVYSKHATCVHVVATNCLTLKECPPPMQARCSGPTELSYYLRFTNGASFFTQHFSAEEMGLTEMAIVFFAFQVVVSAWSVVVAVLLGEIDRLHHTFKLLCFAVALRTAGTACELVHFTTYARTGLRPPGALFMMVLLNELSDLAFLIKGLMLAKGWTICVRKLSGPTRVKLGVFAVHYTATVVGLIVWAFYNNASPGFVSFHDSMPGYVLISLRAVAAVWFAYSVYNTMRKYGVKKRFYRKFSVVYLLYCMSMPVMVGFSHLARFDERPRLINGWQGSVSLAVQAILLFLYTPFMNNNKMLGVFSKVNSSFPFNQTTWEMESKSGTNSGNEPSILVTASGASKDMDEEAARTATLGNTGVIGRRAGASGTAEMDRRMLLRSRTLIDSARREIQRLEEFFDDMEGKKARRNQDEQDEEGEQDERRAGNNGSSRTSSKISAKEEEKKKKKAKEEARMLDDAKEEKKAKEKKRKEEGGGDADKEKEGLFGALRVSSKERAEKDKRKEGDKPEKKSRGGDGDDGDGDGDREYEETIPMGLRAGAEAREGGGATTPNLRNVRLKPLEPLGGTTSASTPPLRPLRPTPLGSGDTSSGAGEGWLRKPLPSLKK
ncbi:transmembrane protein 145 [Pycnococcus provasolii]